MLLLNIPKIVDFCWEVGYSTTMPKLTVCPRVPQWRARPGIVQRTRECTMFEARGRRSVNPEKRFAIHHFETAETIGTCGLNPSPLVEDSETNPPGWFRTRKLCRGQIHNQLTAPLLSSISPSGNLDHCFNPNPMCGRVFFLRGMGG